MKITCPKCGHTAEISESAIPAKTPSVRCHACGTRFPLSKGSGEPVETLEGAPFTCPVCGLGQDRGDVCRECGLIFDKFVSCNAVPFAGGQTYHANVATVKDEVSNDRVSSRKVPLSPHTSICRYLLRFAASYIGLMFLTDIILVDMHNKLSIGIFLGSAIWTLGTFIKARGRFYETSEEWKFCLGFLLISLLYDTFICLMALPRLEYVENPILLFVIAGTFIGSIRLLVLMIFLRFMARRLFGKTDTRPA
jgi:predicted Zn finger-like uncharacterized protein